MFDDIEYKKKRREDPEYRKLEYEWHKKWIEGHREEKIEYEREYREKNAEHMRELSKERTRKCRERAKLKKLSTPL